MELTDPKDIKPFIDLIDQYNQSFYERDIELFRDQHVDDDAFVFYDNHADCDSNNYAEHEAKVQQFFKTGTIVTLHKDNVRVFRSADMACITLTLRYSTQPFPGVRSTYVVERHQGRWKLRHMHHSFDPNESAE